MELPNKKYQVILADPPWEYDSKRDTVGKNNPTGAGGAIKHYQLMNIKDIKSLPFKELADDNCYLFLWVTPPMLKKGIEVIENWGFKYTTIVFAWIKTMKDNRQKPREDGIGNYTLNNIELVLLGRKGKYWRNDTTVKQIIMGLKREHSRKPDEIYTRIEKLFGDVPRIELFARYKREGWDVWGNEAPNFTQLSLPSADGDIIIAKSNKIKDFTSDSSADGRTFANAKGT